MHGQACPCTHAYAYMPMHACPFTYAHARMPMHACPCLNAHAHMPMPKCPCTHDFIVESRQRTFCVSLFCQRASVDVVHHNQREITTIIDNVSLTDLYSVRKSKYCTMSSERGILVIDDVHTIIINGIA